MESLRAAPPGRLRRPEDFAAVLAAPRAQTVRAAQHWLSMTAAWFPDDSDALRGKLRFGAIVGRRNARRAIDRALVKRILREAGRLAAPTLAPHCARLGIRLDVAFRLKAPRGGGGDQPPASVTRWRRALRSEADALLARLERQLAGARA
jgi:ribonuclease P protein component